MYWSGGDESQDGFGSGVAGVVGKQQQRAGMANRGTEEGELLTRCGVAVKAMVEVVRPEGLLGASF